MTTDALDLNSCCKILGTALLYGVRQFQTPFSQLAQQNLRPVVQEPDGINAPPEVQVSLGVPLYPSSHWPEQKALTWVPMQEAFHGKAFTMVWEGTSEHDGGGTASRQQCVSTST